MTRVLVRKDVIAGAVVALVVAVLSVLHLFAAASPKLVWGGYSDAEGWSGPNEPAVGTAISYGGMDPCVSKGSVTVTDIRFTTSHGLVATAWGSRPNPFEHGGNQIAGEATTVAAAGFTIGPRTVSDLCSVETSTGNPANNDFEFAIEFHRTSPATEWANGLTVTYTSAGSSHTTSWPLGYVMCGTTGAVPDDIGALAQQCPQNQGSSSTAH